MKRGAPLKPFPTERDLEWIRLFRSGKTLQQIGTQYGLSRERVRQRLAKNGVSWKEGGMHRQAAERAIANAAARDARYIAKWGLSFAQFRAVPTKARHGFMWQRHSARQRGIEWGFTLAEWWDKWLMSGKFELRGVRKGQYVMSRLNDIGPYTPGNTEIVLGADNIRTARSHSRKTRKPQGGYRGIHKVYPGARKPYILQIKGKMRGTYATVADARAARKRLLEAACSI